MTSAPRHDDRKGRHYYIRMRRPAKPSYSSDDPCGRHEGALVMVLGARHGAGALVMAQGRSSWGFGKRAIMEG